MGQNNLSSIKNYFATDYMLETIFFVYCLLFINTFYLYKLDVKPVGYSRNNILLNSQNNDTTISSKLMGIQSAENCKGFSETARQLPDIEDYKFWNWFAGIIDGDGNFDIRKDITSNKRVLKQIRIKLHNRDVRILTRILDYLHIGAWWSGILPLCLKLSNSGNFLKLTILNRLWKWMSGWSNYSCKVISCKMIERKMEYRGSKSIIDHLYRWGQATHLFISIFVKEQRVDGSWFFSVLIVKLKNLRCTLMDGENSYQVRVPSKQIYGILFRRGFQTNSILRYELTINYPSINPFYLSGFIDGEGCFLIIIRKNNSSSIGWNVALKFQIGLNTKNMFLLERFKEYLIFKQVFSLIKNKEHLTKEGLYQIISLKTSLNLGLSEELKLSFPSIISTLRPLVQDPKIKDPYWMAGFIEAEGSFGIKFSKSNTTKSGYNVYLQFNIVQHIRDEILLKKHKTIF